MGRDLGSIAEFKMIEAQAKVRRASEIRTENLKIDQEAKRRANLVLATANLIPDPRLRKAAIDARISRINADIEHQRSKLKMLQAQMVVDTLSFVDPSIVGCAMVSIWMDGQIEAFDR